MSARTVNLKRPAKDAVTMPRQPRLFYDHVPQHVIQRGNNRQPCFFADSDRHLYLKMLSESSQANSCTVHAYVLMSNHVHLLITSEHPCNIPKMMQTLGRRYVYYINKTYKRSGTLWEGRYKACLVGDPRYVLTCYRYIELNPVRANLCSWPGAYRWSSFRENALGESRGLITPHIDFLSLGTTDDVRRARYLELFEHAMDAQSVDDLRSHTQQQRAYGPPDFQAVLERRLGRPVAVRPQGWPKRSRSGQP